jgi:hypothetical protein
LIVPLPLPLPLLLPVARCPMPVAHGTHSLANSQRNQASLPSAEWVSWLEWRQERLQQESLPPRPPPAAATPPSSSVEKSKNPPRIPDFRQSSMRGSTFSPTVVKVVWYSAVGRSHPRGWVIGVELPS